MDARNDSFVMGFIVFVLLPGHGVTLASQEGQKHAPIILMSRCLSPPVINYSNILRCDSTLFLSHTYSV